MPSTPLQASPPAGFPIPRSCHISKEHHHVRFPERRSRPFSSFGAVAEEFYDAGEHVFVRGRYHAVAKSGQESDARFIHLWTVRDSKLTHLIQAADSHVVQQAANS